jgi:hypothetical protein
MICKNCGKLNKTESTVCIHCGNELNDYAMKSKCLHYSYPEEGFSRPDSKYIKAKVILPENQYGEYNDIEFDYSEDEFISGIEPRISEKEEVFRRNKDRTSQSASRLTLQYEAKLTSQSAYRSALQSKSHLTSQSASRSTLQSESQSTSQSVLQSTSYKQFTHDNLRSQIRNILCPNNIFYAITILVLTILITIVLYFFGLVKDNIFNPNAKAIIEIYSDEENNKTYLYNTQGVNIAEINSSSIPVWYSQDMSKTILLAYEMNRIYYMDIQKGSLLPIDMFSIIMSISTDGKMIYRKGANNDNAKLMLFDPDTNMNNIIESPVGTRADSGCISPDGKTYAYTVIPFNTNDYSECESFISINGTEPKSLGKGKLVFAISNHGNYQYYIKINGSNDRELYVDANGRTTLLTKSIKSFSFNKDYTELLFADKYGAHIVVKGNKIIDLDDMNDAIEKVITTNGIKKSSRYLMYAFDIDTFRNKVIISQDNALRYINKNYKVRTIAFIPPDSNVILSNDGKRIIYRSSDDKIKKFTDFNGTGRLDTIASEVDDYCILNNFNEVYYLAKRNDYFVQDYQNSDLSTYYDLYYKRGNEDPVLIASQVTDLQLNKVSNIVFYIQLNPDGSKSLFYCSRGEGKPIDGYSNADSLEPWNYGIALYVKNNNHYDVLYNSVATDFKFLLTNVGNQSTTMTITYD